MEITPFVLLKCDFSDIFSWYFINARVAQLVEHSTDTRVVPSSNLGTRTNFLYNTSMIQRKSTFFLGIFIFLIPFLGLPSSWKIILVVLSGLGLVGLSVKIILPKKSTKVRSKRGRSTPVFVENIPVYPPLESDTTKLEVNSEKPKIE